MANDVIIPLSECVPGHAYRLVSRNLVVGVFRADVNGFIGIREKLGTEFLFTEYHRDTGAPLGTVRPVADLGPCPIKILSEDLGTRCRTCARPCHYERDRNGLHGSWYHDDDHSELGDGHVPTTIHHDALFAWLVPLTRAEDERLRAESAARTHQGDA